MAHHVLFMFPKGADPTKVEALISGHLVPNTRRASGLRSLTVSEGPLMGAGGPAPYAKVVEATFDSIEDVMSVARSDEAKAHEEELKALGVLLLMYEVREP